METRHFEYRIKTTPLVLSDAAKRQYRKEIIYVGDFEKRDQEGKLEAKFSVDEELLAHWHNTFIAMAANGVDVPVPIDHTTDPTHRRGKVVGSELAKNAKGLPALYQIIEFVSDEAAAQLSNSDVSLYVPPQFTDGKGNTYYRPIRHTALTDYPVIPGLEQFKPICASFAEKKQMAFDPKKFLKKLGIAEDIAEDKLEAAFETAIDELLKKVEKAEPPAKEPPAKKEEPETVAAGFVNMLKDSRQTKINALVGKKILPATAKKLSEQWCNDNALTLALSHDGNVVDGFDATLATFAELPDMKTGESTGSQSISLAHKLDVKNNPLLADAEERAKAARS